MALSTVTSVKTQAGIPASDTSRDDQIAAILAGVTAHVKNTLNRDIEQATYTEYYSGDGTPVLLLRQRPVTSITSIYLDNAGYWGDGANSPFSSPRLLVDGVDYALRRTSATLGSPAGLVYRINGVWNYPTRRQQGYVSNQPGVGNGNLKVTYMAGFPTIPADLQMGVNSLVMRILNAAAMGGQAQQASYEDASVVYLAPGEAAKMMGSIEAALAPHADVPV